jgi:hypothetical protein
MTLLLLTCRYPKGLTPNSGSSGGTWKNPGDHRTVSKQSLVIMKGQPPRFSSNGPFPNFLHWQIIVAPIGNCLNGIGGEEVNYAVFGQVWF